MSKDINYASLPSETPASSPWSVLRVAVFITAALFLILGPVIYVSNKNPDSPLQIVPVILMVLAFLAIAFGAYRSLTGKLRNQRRIMMRFAKQNGWDFEGSKNSNDAELLPPGWTFQGNSSRQLYRIHGNLGGKDFELYSLMGADKAIIGSGNRITIGYRTAVRTHTELKPAPPTSKVKVVTEKNWRYALMDGNAMNTHELQSLLQHLLR